MELNRADRPWVFILCPQLQVLPVSLAMHTSHIRILSRKPLAHESRHEWQSLKEEPTASLPEGLPNLSRWIQQSGTDKIPVSAVAFEFTGEAGYTLTCRVPGR